MVGESKKLLLPPPLKSLFINALRVMVRAVRVKREKKNGKKKSGCGGGESFHRAGGQPECHSQ